MSYLASTCDLARIPLSQLETQNLIEIPPQLTQLGITDWHLSLPKRRELIGLDPPFQKSSSPTRLDIWLSDNTSAKRRREWSFRTGEELRNYSNFYIFFVTLTCNPKLCDAREIIEGGIEWRRYRERVAEVVRQACGLRQQHQGGPPRSTYFRYVAVTEHGAKRTHHHIHALLFCRDIPAHWKRDPNRHRARTAQNATDVIPLKSMWPWGHVTKASPFRFIGDRWTKEGWIVPLVDGKRIRMQAPEVAGGYLSKYQQKECKEWNHRTKATRGFGLRQLRTLTRSLKLRDLMTASVSPWDPDSRSCLNETAMPPSLMRREARYEICRRMHLRGLSGWQRLGRWMTRTRENVYSRMRVSVRDGSRPWSMDSLTLWTWLLAFIYRPEANVSSDRLLEFWRRISSVWPKPATRRSVEALAGVSWR